LTSNKSAQQRGDEKHQGVREEPRLKALMNKEAHRWQQGNVNKHQECTTQQGGVDKCQKHIAMRHGDQQKHTTRRC